MLTPVGRASSTHRRYTEADVTWVTFLTKLRSTAMPIARAYSAASRAIVAAAASSPASFAAPIASS